MSTGRASIRDGHHHGLVLTPGAACLALLWRNPRKSSGWLLLLNTIGARKPVSMARGVEMSGHRWLKRSPTGPGVSVLLADLYCEGCRHVVRCEGGSVFVCGQGQGVGMLDRS